MQQLYEYIYKMQVCTLRCTITSMARILYAANVVVVYHACIVGLPLRPGHAGAHAPAAAEEEP